VHAAAQKYRFVRLIQMIADLYFEIKYYPLKIRLTCLHPPNQRFYLKVKYHQAHKKSGLAALPG
jgi:hypothetical protein